MGRVPGSGWHGYWFLDVRNLRSFRVARIYFRSRINPLPPPPAVIAGPSVFLHIKMMVLFPKNARIFIPPFIICLVRGTFYKNTISIYIIIFWLFATPLVCKAWPGRYMYVSG